jgi:aromatic ring-opening dioxygenase catalytic subunit (LigB family)
MAQIVFAAAASHAPGLTGWMDKAPVEDQEVVRRAYGELHERLVRSRCDVLLVIGNDHLSNYRVSKYPDFTVGMAAEHVGPDDWFRPWLNLSEYRLPGAPEVAATVADGLSRRGHDVTRAYDNLRFDDNISVPTALLRLPETGIAVIPILQNCTVPPILDERRCYAVGQALGELVREGLPPDLRVGLLGSGGLSHEPGGPRYLQIDEDFDRWFLRLLEAGDHGAVLEQATLERMETAGSGGTAELLSWLVVMGAIGEHPCTALGYACVSQWRCGVGAVTWELA